MGLGDGREIYILQPERQPNKVLKVQNKYKSSSKNFQPGTTDDSGTKADKTHVSPAIAKPTVIGIFGFVQRLKPQKSFLFLTQ
ncbi:MAG: hypothetical protein WBO44_14235 [Saprospiraceae bacterium]